MEIPSQSKVWRGLQLLVVYIFCIVADCLASSQYPIRFKKKKLYQRSLCLYQNFHTSSCDQGILTTLSQPPPASMTPCDNQICQGRNFRLRKTSTAIQQLLLCLSWQKRCWNQKHQHFSLFPASSPFLSSLIISNYSILPLKLHLGAKPQNQPLCKQGLEFLQRSERDRATLPA